MSEQRPDPVRIMARQQAAPTDYVIRLARPISDADDFAEEFQVFANATPQDVIQLEILSGGGLVDTAHMITRAMHRCEAHIIGWIGPTCASAAGAIALSCDEWEVDDMSTLMVHTGSFGVGYGKTQDVVAYALQSERMIERFMWLTYKGFLTDDEIQQVIDGKEMYFDVENGLVERLTALAEYREALKEALDKAEAQ
jgi:ATP-dependent protease ClpP protease subunit